MLSSGRIDEAWQQYTSPAYKQRYPLEEYRTHWQNVLLEKGKITGHESYNNESSYDMIKDKKTDRFQYRLSFGKQQASELLFYQVIITEQGVNLIDYAGRRLQGNQTISGQERMTPEPW